MAFDVVRVIPLETDLKGINKGRQVPMIGNIQKVRITSDRVFLTHRISDLNSPLCAYDLDGKFLWVTTRGKGPGEIIEAQTLSVSPSGLKVCIIQGRNVLFEYSKEGDFLRKLKLPMSCTEVIYVSENVWIIKPTLWTSPEYAFYFYNGNDLRPGPMKNTYDPKLSLSDGEMNLYRKGSRILYKNELNDTVFKLSESICEKEYILDFEPKGIGDIKSSDLLTKQIPFNWLVEQNIGFQDAWIYEFDQTLYFDAIYDMSRFVCKYDLTSDEFKASRWDDLKVLGIPYNWTRFRGCANNSVVLSIQANVIAEAKDSGNLNLSILNHNSQELLSKIDPLANPVLLLVK